LLNRGYSRKQALLLVAGRYGLLKAEAAILYRCVHEESYNEDVAKKLRLGRGSSAAVVDFFNVATTVAEHLEGWTVFKCTDFVVRDNAVAEGRSKKDREKLLDAFKIVAAQLEELGVREVVVVADKQKPFSKAVVEEALSSVSALKARAVLAEKADIAVIRESSSLGAPAVTSDRVVLERVGAAIDVVGSYLDKLGWPRTLDVRSIVDELAGRAATC